MDNFDAQVGKKFEEALALHNLGHLQEARLAYEAVLAVCPAHAESLHNIGLLLAQNKLFQDALVALRRSLEINPIQPIYLSNYANVLAELNRHAEALPFYRKAIEIAPDYVDALYNFANALASVGEFQAAIENYQRVNFLSPKWAEPYLNCGAVFDALGQYEAALTCIKKAIECKPELAGAHLKQKELEAKLEESSSPPILGDRLVSQESNQYNSYVTQAENLINNSLLKEAIEPCQRALKINPLGEKPYFLMGVAYFQIGDMKAALPQFEKVVDLKPSFPASYNFLGLVNDRLGDSAKAHQYFHRALELNPSLHAARVNLADSLFSNGEFQLAIDNFKLLPPELQPQGLIQFLKMQLGDWRNYDAEKAAFLRDVAKVRFAGMTEDPWHLLRITDSAVLAKEVAQNFARSAMRFAPSKQLPIAKRKRAPKIKIGYFSPDFREHAVSHLAMELFARHSRENFEIYAFSFGKLRAGDAYRRQVIKTFDDFYDINGMNDAAVVQLARELEIDIAIDLSGYTENSRPAIFALRAAPIQVNFLGYTGTLGTSFHEYIIGDPVVIPPALVRCYTEKVVHLPCMLPYDTRLSFRQNKPARKEVGLPESGFIFCVFNQAFKYTPEVFHSWLRILSRTKDSYLWFNSCRPGAVETLKKVAEAAGVSPQRLIFTSRVSAVDDHLARLKCADLFLDTFPYNAHTSAADALWAGIPVITRQGESFASRLAGSLVSSLGLAELIVPNIEAYEALAIELATHPEKVSALKNKIEHNREICPLFNMKQYVKNYEQALTMMYERYQADLAPDHIIVS